MRTSPFAVLLLAAMAAGPASAQDEARSDAFAGYSMLRSGDSTLHGWNAALGLGFSRRLALVVDLSGHDGSDEEGTDVSALALMGGPRLAFSTGRTRPFVHVLAGVVRSKAGIEVSGVDISETSTDAGGAAGGGIDFGFGARWAARAAADYRVMRIERETVGDPRISIGIVRRFGR